MSNLIDRQAAIDMINIRLSQRYKRLTSEYIEGMKDGYYRIRSDIERLPSAEPDWSYDADTKEITLVVPEDIYNHAKTVFLSVGHEGSFGLRGKVYSAQPEIVFCKQCKYFEEADEDSGDAWCYAWGNTTAGDQFCSCGENIKDE